MVKTNKSGNMRGMSKGSQEVVKRNNFKNKTKEERCEIATKGANATNLVISLKKTACDIAKEEADLEVTNKNGEKCIYRRALIKKIKQMALNGNLNAIVLYLKLLGEMPADKLELSGSEQVKQGLDKINEYFGSNQK